MHIYGKNVNNKKNVPVGFAYYANQNVEKSIIKGLYGCATPTSKKIKIGGKREKMNKKEKSRKTTVGAPSCGNTRKTDTTMPYLHGNKARITLVALVITIIVLLILAGITINLTVGQRGILTRAEEGTGWKNGKTVVQRDKQVWNYITRDMAKK